MATDAGPLPDHSLDGGQRSPDGGTDKKIAIHKGDKNLAGQGGRNRDNPNHRTEPERMHAGRRRAPCAVPSAHDALYGERLVAKLIPLPTRQYTGDDFRDYWDYQPREHAVTYRGE